LKGREKWEMGSFQIKQNGAGPGNKKPRVSGVNHLKEVRGRVVRFRFSMGKKDSNLFNVSRLQKLSPGLDHVQFSKDWCCWFLKGLGIGLSQVWIQVRLKIGLSFRSTETVWITPFHRYDNTKMV
jgi:hypothetical protein